ncbi:hypothetical protein NPIL_236621 [Nephila pilipes]|uniref:Uncharacterized protein n=1 Tax=Nephila pilipes TaxID=299642 RepID=A0A8X6U252_NEPPI|nr:hypothetical protein NPIL_236621 [Nephila pilipes]
MEDQKTRKEHIKQIKVAKGKVKASMTRLENTAEDLILKNKILIRLKRIFFTILRNGKIIGSEGQPIAHVWLGCRRSNSKGLQFIFLYAIAFDSRKKHNSSVDSATILANGRVV